MKNLIDKTRIVTLLAIAVATTILAGRAPAQNLDFSLSRDFTGIPRGNGSVTRGNFNSLLRLDNQYLDVRSQAASRTTQAVGVQTAFLPPVYRPCICQYECLHFRFDCRRPRNFPLGCWVWNWWWWRWEFIGWGRCGTGRIPIFWDFCPGDLEPYQGPGGHVIVFVGNPAYPSRTPVTIQIDQAKLVGTPAEDDGGGDDGGDHP